MYLNHACMIYMYVYAIHMTLCFWSSWNSGHEIIWSSTSDCCRSTTRLSTYDFAKVTTYEEKCGKTSLSDNRQVAVRRPSRTRSSWGTIQPCFTTFRRKIQEKTRFFMFFFWIEATWPLVGVHRRIGHGTKTRRFCEHAAQKLQRQIRNVVLALQHGALIRIK